MKQFFNYFKIPFILIAIMAIVCIGVRISKSGSTEITWTNEDTDLTGNVFDYAENLTDAQERELDELISSIEDRVKCDIAVITLDRSLSLEGYKSQPSQWVMEYADDFADEHKMGYDKAYGNSIVFIDNLHREERTGRVYSWISTSGLAMQTLSQSDCEEIMDVALADLDDYSDEDDYYAAYSQVIRLLPSYFEGGSAKALKVLKPLYIAIFSLAVALIYVLFNWSSKVGDKTTKSTTYVENGRPTITHQGDVFLRKSVSKVKIETSSGSGGHISSGGHSHGGGGHSR